MIGWLTQESKKCLRDSIKQPQSTIRERIDYYKESRGKEELGLSGVKWVTHFFEEYEENVGNSDKEAIAYLVLDEAEILLKTIQGHDKVCDPPPPIDGSEGMESTPKYVIPMLPARSTEVANNST